jgi:uncharacterized membrane protein YtjA (UPF0391 family)
MAVQGALVSCIACARETGRAESVARPLLQGLGATPAWASQKGGIAMLYWAAVFFVIAIVAAFFGFGGLAASAAGIAKILFFVFLAFAVVSFLFGRRSAI